MKGKMGIHDDKKKMMIQDRKKNKPALRNEGGSLNPGLRT